MLKYFSSIGNMFSFSPHVKIFWVTGTMLQTQKIVFPTLHRACSRLALELGGSVDRGMRAAVWVEYDAEAEKPRTSFGVLAPIFPPSPPLVLGPEHAANGCGATPARHAQHSTAGGKYLQFSGRQLRRDKSVLWSQPAATISAPHRTNTYRAAHSDSVLANNTSSMLRRWAGQR